MSPLDAAVRYAISISEIKKILVGVDSVNQLQQILKTSKGVLPEVPNDMFTDDPAFTKSINVGVILKVIALVQARMGSLRLPQKS